MIQMLPLLPPDWGTWKWDEGNLSATTEQTQQSYQTLIEKGLCANFSRFVWNDIVDLTANALEAAGIPWDSRYGSVESCKITDQMGAFMANMFNGVATNINRLGLFRWKWEVNYKDQSYLGRPYVYGASTHGEKADNIYAMYILELVKRLNWFLSVLKDEANFAEQIITNESRLTIHPKFTSLVTAPSRAYENILSSSFSKAHALRVAPQKSIIRGCSLNDGALLARDVASANAGIISNLSIDAVSRMIYTLSIRIASLFISSKPYATLNDVSTTGCLSHNHTSTSSIFALMEANLRELYIVLNVISNQVGRVTSSPDIILYSTPIIESLGHATIVSSHVEPIIIAEHANSLATSVLGGLAGNYFSCDSISTSHIDTEIELKRLLALRDSPFMETIPHGVISTAISSSGRFNEGSKSSIVAKPKRTVSKGICYKKEAIAYCLDELRTVKVSAFDIDQYCNTTIDTAMGTKRTAHGSSDLHIGSFYAQVPLALKECVSISSPVCTRSYIDVVIANGIPYAVYSINKSDSSSFVCVNAIDPEKVAYADGSISLIKADVKLKNGKRLLSVATAESGLIGEMSFATKLTDVSIKAVCNTYAVMENGAVPEGDTWYDHVQTGSDLYIRQTYEDPIQTGTDLDISEVFFEPVVDGSNLHIISAASFGGE